MELNWFSVPRVVILSSLTRTHGQIRPLSSKCSSSLAISCPIFLVLGSHFKNKKKTTLALTGILQNFSKERNFVHVCERVSIRISPCHTAVRVSSVRGGNADPANRPTDYLTDQLADKRADNSQRDRPF